MKKLLGILLVMVILFASCERKSGHLSPSGQRAAERRAAERTEIKSEVKTEMNIRVEIVSESERILIDGGIEKYKVKVKVINDSTVCYVLLNNVFEIGEQIEIKPTQRILN